MDPTNEELMTRLTRLENKVDDLSNIMKQAAGAWFFVKLMASVAVGIAIVFGTIQGWMK